MPPASRSNVETAKWRIESVAGKLRVCGAGYCALADARHQKKVHVKPTREKGKGRFGVQTVPFASRAILRVLTAPAGGACARDMTGRWMDG